MFNNIFQIIKKNYPFIFLLGLFWISINTGSKYLNINQITEFNLSYLFNLSRAILPYLILLYFIFNFNKFFKKLDFKTDLIFLCFLLYGIIQLLGLIYFSNNYSEHYWVVCLFSLIIFYQNTLSRKNTDLVNVIFISNILFVFIIFLIFSFITLKENFFSYNLLYHSRAFTFELVGEKFPRSSGISRMALILFFFLTCLYFSKIFEKKMNYLILFIISFVIFIILLLQSRTTILFLPISLIVIYLFFKFDGYKDQIKFSIFAIILPIFLFFIYPISKNYIIEKYEINTEGMVEDKDKVNFLRNDLVINKKHKHKTKNFNLNEFSNNRLDAWNYLLQIYFYGELNERMEKKVKDRNFIPINKKLEKNKLKYFTGLGPQADRHLMRLERLTYLANPTLGPFGAHASNVFVYSLICGGIFSFGLFLIINLVLIFRVWKIVNKLNKLNLNKNYVLITCIFTILFLMFRGLIENSYGVFGVDLILFLSAYTVLEKNYKEIYE